jgi:poly(3-hydroxybutyrate) depolymerase
MPQGEGALWSDASGPRVSMILVSGMGHAFPAGEGDGLETNFVAQRGVAWPSYVLAFFEDNNRRSDRPAPDGGMETPDAMNDPGADAQKPQNALDAGHGEVAAEGCACSASRGGSSLLWLLLLLVRRR